MESQDRVSMERTFRQVEFRAEGRRLSGTVLAYGDTSPSHRERFEPGSIRMANAIPLNLRHDTERAVAWYPGGGLRLDDGSDALRMTAELPPLPAADRALDEVRAGKLAGLSVEFISNRETRQDGLRIIQDAFLSGIGLVDAPSYQASIVEARARKGKPWGRATIPVNRIADCECVGPYCRKIRIEPGAFERVLARAAANEIDIPAHTGRFRPENMLASTGAGTLTLAAMASGLLMTLLGEAALTQAGEAVAASMEASPPIVRPLIDQDESEYTDEEIDGEMVRVYQDAALQSILVKWSQALGWETIELVDAPEPSTPPRRIPRWL